MKNDQKIKANQPIKVTIKTTASPTPEPGSLPAVDSSAGILGLGPGGSIPGAPSGSSESERSGAVRRKPDVYKIVMKDSLAVMPRELSLVCLVRTMAQEFNVTPEHMARKLIGESPMFRTWRRERENA